MFGLILKYILLEVAGLICILLCLLCKGAIMKVAGHLCVLPSSNGALDTQRTKGADNLVLVYDCDQSQEDPGTDPI